MSSPFPQTHAGCGTTLSVRGWIGVAMGKPAPLTRSEVMARIRGRDTSPELALRKELHARGARFRVDFRIPGVGRVDIAFTRRRLAIFVDGCFWHCCPEHGVRPKTNVAFWRDKLDGNRARDAKQVLVLQSMGWSVIRVWEHDLEEDLASVTRTVLEVLHSPEEDHQ